MFGRCAVERLRLELHSGSDVDRIGAARNVAARRAIDAVLARLDRTGQARAFCCPASALVRNGATSRGRVPHQAVVAETAMISAQPSERRAGATEPGTLAGIEYRAGGSEQDLPHLQQHGPG